MFLCFEVTSGIAVRHSIRRPAPSQRETKVIYLYQRANLRHKISRNNLQISKGEFNRASDKGLWVTKQKRTLDIWGMAGLFDGGTNHLALTHLKIHEKFFGPGYFLSNLIIWEVKLLLSSSGQFRVCHANGA
ncbi:uncharacterized protein LOC111254556 [Varroa destructor]|uniref:Uncharacterized protein n=1 Tax=Varroa destructor TaxID=109461 RepID=A0A7M7KVK3_VARDE|nr:uncharacterized protein LOC111254556 [Varroa destructor]